MQPIVIESLTKTYRGKRGKRVEALKGIDLTVDQGEVFGFIGPNGAGKSTTIKILVGLLRASSGSALLCGRVAEDPAGRNDIGFLPENPALYDFLTAREYLTLVGKTFGLDGSQLRRCCDETLELVGLLDAANRPVRSYSKGMVQRLGLAQTLVHDPQIYILDEPMSGLDPMGRALVKRIILDLKQQGKTVFFSTHITADVEVLCDRVGILINGKLMLVDDVKSILSRSIQGYQVNVLSDKKINFPGVVQGVGGDVNRYFVPYDCFNGFVDAVRSENGEIESIDIQRKGVEDLFLELIQ